MPSFKGNLTFTHKSTKRFPKNTQFAIRWSFNRFLSRFYPSSIHNNLETRLDILLFRTHWFLNFNSIIFLIKHGFVMVNNVVIYHPHLKIYPGDIVHCQFLKLQHTPLIQKFNQFELLNNYESNPIYDLNEWKKLSSLHLIQNLNYLEINNSTHTFILLKSPSFHNIPYPFNLHKFQ